MTDYQKYMFHVERF